MSTSRREFLKNSAVLGAGAALGSVSAWPEGTESEIANDTANAPVSDSATAGYSRGLGVYPGMPSEYFGPSLANDPTTYRNLALQRPAFASSSYDYNLTAQLVTDGIKHTQAPRWVAVADSATGPLPRESREQILDHAGQHLYELRGQKASLTIQMGGGEAAPEVDRVELLFLAPAQVRRERLRFQVSRSNDGRIWEQAGSAEAPEIRTMDDCPPDFARIGNLYSPAIAFSSVGRERFYQVEFIVDSGADPELEMIWQVAQVKFFRGDERVNIGGPYSFTSAWMSAGMGEEWIYVDLGATCEFDRVKLFWIARCQKGAVQVSGDNESWLQVASLDGGTGAEDDIRLAKTEHGRYVRVLMREPSSPDGFILSELEVWGRGGFVAGPNASSANLKNGKLDMAGGAWRLQRASQVDQGGEAVSKTGFADENWLPATVPGTVLTSYVNAGAIPDPNFGENQLHISDSFFYSDFWYRKEFAAPDVGKDETAWLHFGGVNWKAEVWLNGAKLGRIEGGFLRGCFEVTGRLVAGRPNVLAVRIEKNATPGSAKQKTLERVGQNGGALGADNPTYHASIGWDWIPTIRGRNTGIWGDVNVEVTGTVTLENPFVRTELPLPTVAAADVILETEVVNHRERPFKGMFRASFGDAHVEERLQLAPHERRKLRLDPSGHPELRLKEPKLWWPAGYGEPHLYPVKLSVEANGRVLHAKEFFAGVRQMSASEESGALQLFVNGRRFIARGGNWGFGESMLRYRAREYDAAVRYHREMNFTMIRDWVGQIGDDAFYDACDRHGVMVWQDFWLANPWDGPDPEDTAMFLANVRDYVLRIRNHPSVGLYCGRNEGFPPKAIESGIRQTLGELHPGLHYIPSSADGPVSGHGPYQAMPREFYFSSADSKLHSEIGAPNIPPIESVRLMMPEKDLWPQSLSWGLHDFCLDGAQGGKGFRSILSNQYGGADSAEEWLRLAQFVNYDTYRAMFEAQSTHRMGVLLWMSHPCWPSFVWQTYDYYFEPTAAYFGCKKGSEPLHIQWNSLQETVEVVNYSAGDAKGLTAEMDIRKLDGSLAGSKSATIDSHEDSVVTCFRMEYPSGLTPVHFIRVRLLRGSEVISNNFYWRGLTPGDYRALRELPKARVSANTETTQKGNRIQLTTALSNPGNLPALMVRLKAVRERSGDRILPAIYSDNYVSLMPGESCQISVEVNETDTRGELPRIVIAS